MNNKTLNSSPYAVVIKNLTVAYNYEPVLYDCNLSIEKNKLIAIIGSNGAGKSTLLKSILSLVKPLSGQISFFDGQRLDKAVRKRIAYVPQSDSVDWDFPATVLDIVSMGRYAHLGLFSRVGKRDIELSKKALQSVFMQDFSSRQISELSGGQRQRVFLARAIVQDADIYFMDEPFKGVDALTEKAIVLVLKTLKEQNKTVIVVHHDLSTVKEYFDDVIILNKKVIAYGSVEDVFIKNNIDKAYQT